VDIRYSPISVEGGRSSHQRAISASAILRQPPPQKATRASSNLQHRHTLSTSSITINSNNIPNAHPPIHQKATQHQSPQERKSKAAKQQKDKKDVHPNRNTVPPMRRPHPHNTHRPLPPRQQTHLDVSRPNHAADQYLRPLLSEMQSES